MQREITIKELENTVSTMDSIDEPIIVKRNNKQDLVVINLEKYKQDLFIRELSVKLEKSEKEYKAGKVKSARTVFKRLREEYGY